MVLRCQGQQHNVCVHPQISIVGSRWIPDLYDLHAMLPGLSRVMCTIYSTCLLGWIYLCNYYYIANTIAHVCCRNNCVCLDSLRCLPTPCVTQVCMIAAVQTRFVFHSSVYIGNDPAVCSVNNGWSNGFLKPKGSAKWRPWIMSRGVFCYAIIYVCFQLRATRTYTLASG